MAGVRGRRSVSYFAHDRSHRLLPAEDEDGEFTCDGCLVAGAGPRYRCSSPGCGFKLHEVCARRFPRTLKSVFHSQHRLKRRATAADHGVGASRCEVCGEDVRGAWYGCRADGAVVHPLCVRLPPVARGSPAAHPGCGKDAWLVKKTDDAGESACCAACGRGVGPWRYRCGTCGVDVHPRCLVPAADQCRGGEASATAAGKRFWLGAVHNVTSWLNVSYLYRGAY